ncbi:MAG: carbohydrate-binding protein SusD [Chitinophagaceae bacterium]|nr:carbohydrate-binding protein SusD [Chitinophagaceae bacterium]
MKKSYKSYIVLFIAAVSILAACKKAFLEVHPVGGTALESGYYKNAAEVFNGLVATYDPLGSETGGTYSDKVGLLNAASDDCGAGGGSATDQVNWANWDNFTVTVGQGPQGDLWGRNYTGIYRANLLLSKMENVPDLTAAQKGRYTAEVKFLRAYYYFDLVRLFKNVPLITASIPTAEIYNIPQAKPEEVYAQIEKDLTEAIAEANLPNTVSAATEGGRVTKGAAKALLGKVYLYEEKWAAAAQQLGDVNGTPGGTSTYGYKLLSNFGDIFKPTNKFNSESIFEIVHTSQARQDWNAWGAFEGNVMVQMVGPRNYNGPIYVTGWGFCPLTTELVNAIKNDPRYPYTAANIDSIVNAAPGRTYEKGYQNTGYFIEKYAPKSTYRSTLGGVADLNYPYDYIEIRLADTYLMEAEALVHTGSNTPRAQALLDAVRARVGLASVPVSLPSIYNERRLELATEGHRFFDLVRTGQAATVLAPFGFKTGKNEYLPIPLNDLNNTKLVQNAGY